MTSSLVDLLPLFALDVLDPDEAEAVAAALAVDPALRRELVVCRGVVHDTAWAVAAEAPDPSLRARLLASLDDREGLAAPDRIARIASLFDVSIERARALFGWVDDPSRWTAMAPGVQIASLRPGPAQRGQQCGLIRVAAGARFPWHGHLGEEIAIVMTGGCRMADGRDVTPGDAVHADPTIEHDFVADPESECVLAFRAAGIELRSRS